MKMETKINLYTNLFNSLIFGALFTILGGLLTSGAVDWANFPLTALVGILAGFIIGMVLPIGKWGAAVAGKVAKPGTFLFNLVMYAVLLVIFLVFMCPILTLFIGSVLMGAPVAVMLPNAYSLFLPFFGIGLVVLMIFGGQVMKLALKCAGVSGEAGGAAPVPSDRESRQEKM